MVIFRRFKSSTSTSNLHDRDGMKAIDLEKDNISICGGDALTETSSVTDVSSIISEYQRCVGRRNRTDPLTKETSSLSDSLSRSKPSEEIIAATTPLVVAAAATSAAATAAAAKSGLKKSVRFSDIHIREYERIVGDNPSCSSGPPIGIGWGYLTGDVHRVEAFERNRGLRKKQLEMVLTRADRERLLQEWGASWHDVLDAIRANHKAKNQRRRTVNNLGKAEKIEEVMESVARKLKRTLLIKKSTGTKVKELEQQAKVAGALKRRNSFPPSSMAQTPSQDGNGSTMTNKDWESISEWASTIGDDDASEYDGVVEIDDPSSSDGSLHELLEQNDFSIQAAQSPVSQDTNSGFEEPSSFSFASHHPNRNFDIYAMEPSSGYPMYEGHGEILSVGNHMVMAPSSYASSHGSDGPSINSHRHSFPVVITEDEDDQQISEYYDFSFRRQSPHSFHPQQHSGFAMAPPPRSTSFVSSWT